MLRAQKRWGLVVGGLLAVATTGAIFFVRWRQQFLPHVVSIAPPNDAAQVVSLSSDGQYVALSLSSKTKLNFHNDIEVRELLSNRRVAFFPDVKGGIFSPNSRFLTLVHARDTHTKKSAFTELVEVGSWKSKYRLPFKIGGRLPYTGEFPWFIYSKSGEYLLTFDAHGPDQRAEIWTAPFITPKRAFTLENAVDADASLKDNGELIIHELRDQPTKSPLGLKHVTIESPITFSCPGSTLRGSNSRLKVGMQETKLWHAFLFDSWTGKILKDLRDHSKPVQGVYACGISGDEKTVAVCYDTYIGIWSNSGSNWKLVKKIASPSKPDRPISWKDVIFLSEHGEFLVQNLANNRLYWRRLK